MRHLTGARHLYLPGRIALLLVVVAGLMIVACGDSNADKDATPRAQQPLKKITFMAGFQPQANLPFVGAYVAQEKGFFRDQGLDVEIQHSDGSQHLQLLLAGQVDITTANGASVLKRNDQGFPVVSIALIGQKPETGFAVAASSGINSPADWPGKTLGYKGSVPAEFFAVARATRVDPDKVKQVRVGFDPRVLSEGQVDILPVFFSNEPDTLDKIGFKTRVFDPKDFGVESLGLTYIATRDFINKNPDTAERFLKAVLRGIEFADQNRDAALDIVMKYAPQQDRDHQRFMMNTELDRAKTDLTLHNGIGWQTQEQWQRAADSLLEFSGIEKKLDVSQVFTDQFLKQAYKNGKLQWP